MTRVTSGPEIRGCRPVLVAFLHFKVRQLPIFYLVQLKTLFPTLFKLSQDREEVLSKSKLLKSANIYVSEDLSRKTREHRNELFKYMRFVSSTDSEAYPISYFLRSSVELRTASVLSVMTNSSWIMTFSFMMKQRAE